MRVPPTEKRGRVHTSSVSVALLEGVSKTEVEVDRNDVTEYITRGSGNGGQHRNKVETCVTLLHHPTGIKVMCQDSRKKTDNQKNAWKELLRRLSELEFSKNKQNQKQTRIDQIGHGGRGEKIRTYRCIDDVVIDHITGKRISIKDFERGKISKLHKQ